MTTENIQDLGIDEVFAERYAIYGAATVKARAIPAIEDGLNPVTRRILWAVGEDGYSLKKRKAAYYVGLALAKYHPHGDSSVYETLVGICQSFNKLNPLMLHQGNVGSMDDFKSFAAQRYVEMSLAPFSKDIFFTDMNAKFVPMKDNYDASCLEPIHLPATFPTILNTGTMGIATGFASEIPPHKVDDICDLTVRYLKNPKVSDKDLVGNFRPDFPAGGIIVNEAELPEIYTKGNGKIYVQAEIEDGLYANKPALIVKDLPYKVSTSKILQELQELVSNDPKTKQPRILADKLADVKDLSSKTQAVELVLIPKREVSLAVLRNLILEHTSLRITVKYLPNVLSGDNLIENAPLRTMLEHWVTFRKRILTRKYNYEVQIKSEQQLLKRALIKAHANIDKVLKLVRSAKSKDDAVDSLSTLLNITRRESEYIVSIQLYQISKLEVSKLKDDIAALQADIDYNISLISDNDKLEGEIVSQLQAIKKKYQSKRRSTLSNNFTKDFDVRSVIESEDLVIAVSSDNYLYAKAVDDMREYAARGAKGSNFIDKKYNRIVRDIFTVNSHDDLFVFTDKGMVIECKGYELNLWHKPISHAISDLGNQTVIAVIKAHHVEDADKAFTFITANSVMKRVLVKEMICKRKMTGGNIAIRIDEGDALIGVVLVESDEDRIVITSNKGRMQNLTASAVAVALRPTRGFPKATLTEGEEIKCITVIPESQVESALVIVAASNGIGKVVELTDLPERRGESGKRALNKIITLGQGAELICGRFVLPEDSLVATTSGNKTTKISASIVRKTGRNAKGVKLLTMEGKETLLDVAVV